MPNSVYIASSGIVEIASTLPLSSLQAVLNCFYKWEA